MSSEMTYSHLGRSGLQVSCVGLGTMRFGFTADEPASVAIMDAAIEAGVNFFDTADVYGGPQSPDMDNGYGISEEILGRWLQRTGRRDEIVLATKVYQPMGTGPNDRRLSAYHIRRAWVEPIDSQTFGPRVGHEDVVNPDELLTGWLTDLDRIDSLLQANVAGNR